ncbi:MAG TPA: site-2 protease family protein [Alphaproteobacteria bacterium]|nr:site-2 protease family protein [Alphaproteobacteria bacterium]
MESLSTIAVILIIAIPGIMAITFHEAAHGFVAKKLGDDTAFRAGRVTFNPLKHIDLVGTIILPAIVLWASRGAFLFGYAKPVPVDFSRLDNPRRDMILVAAAGPGINILLALISSVLLHLVDLFVGDTASTLRVALGFSVFINALFAVFNLLPLPPLDGGRILVGLLPHGLASRLARIEPFGIFLLIAIILLVPTVAAQFGVRFNIFSSVIIPAMTAVTDLLGVLTGAEVTEATRRALGALQGTL